MEYPEEDIEQESELRNATTGDLILLFSKLSNRTMKRSRSLSQDQSVYPKMRLSSMKKQVDECRAVSDLPLITMLDSSTSEKIPWSCGILCYNTAGDSWLLISSRTSVCIRVILKGAYATCSIPVMVQRMKPEEREILLSILSHGKSKEGYKQFEITCMSTFGKTFGKYTRKSWFRMIELTDLFMKSMERYGVSDGDLWSWPKGRPDNKSESSLDCAVRELKEETGLDLYNVRHRIWQTPVIVTFYSYIRAAFVYEYWLCFVDEESEVTIADVNEASSVKWVQTEDLESHLSDEGKTVLEKVIESTKIPG